MYAPLFYKISWQRDLNFMIVIFNLFDLLGWINCAQIAFFVVFNGHIY
jgi:hypothetical protein